MRNVLLALMVATAFGLAAAPAANAASVTVHGDCWYNGNGAEEDVTVSADSSGPSVDDGPDEGAIEDGLTACANAAQDGSAPDDGELSAEGSAQGQSAGASTATITDQLP